MRPVPYAPEWCPRCGASSPCTDWSEVDIGVGVQTFDPKWTCPTHGQFAYVPGPTRSVAVFRLDPTPGAPP